MIAEGEVMQLAAAKNTATTEDEYLAVIRAKTAELFAAACEVGPVLAKRPKAEQAACRSFGMNLGIAFQLVDDALDYGGKAAKLGKNVGDDFREGKITLPVVLAFRRGSDAEREFWRRTLERGEATDADLEHAIGLMTKHRAIEDTIERARHYGAIARDALALFPRLRHEAGAGGGGRVHHRPDALEHFPFTWKSLLDSARPRESGDPAFCEVLDAHANPGLPGFALKDRKSGKPDLRRGHERRKIWLDAGYSPGQRAEIALGILAGGEVVDEGVPATEPALLLPFAHRHFRIDGVVGRPAPRPPQRLPEIAIEKDVGLHRDRDLQAGRAGDLGEALQLRLVAGVQRILDRLFDVAHVSSVGRSRMSPPPTPVRSR